MTVTTERPRYYPRQVVTADDLELEQDYLYEKLKRHNRMLHGWGIVCGIKVEAVPAKPWYVKVSPGYIVCPPGDEICVDKTVCCDLRIKCAAAVTTDDGCGCSDSVSQLPPSKTDTIAYLVIKYQREMTRPVRVRVSGCGCGENPCEYSRSKDGYQICVLDEAPDQGTDTGGGQLGPGEAPDCLPMPPNPWVLLAQVTVQPDGTVGAVDLSGRRILPRR